MKNKTEIRMVIYCCACEKDTLARLTDGREIYPHRSDLEDTPFWICEKCNNYVGCHPKTNSQSVLSKPDPLGCIPTPEIKKMRIKIHSVFDLILKRGLMTKSKLYKFMRIKTGANYHTGNIKSVSQAREILKIAEEILSGR